MVRMRSLLANDSKLLWDYMQLGQPIRAADLLLVLGSRDDRVAVCGAAIAQQFHYWYVVVTGGAPPHNRMLASWPEPTEAEHFAAVMKANGYAKSIMLETAAHNTGENARNTFRLLQATNQPMPLTIQIVTNPWMERRALATFEAQWPDRDATFSVTSPNLTFAQYCPDDQKRDEIINVLVGYMQRIMTYPALGFQTKQAIPAAVHAAYTRLVAAGYTKDLQK